MMQDDWIYYSKYTNPTNLYIIFHVAGIVVFIEVGVQS